MNQSIQFPDQEKWDNEQQCLCFPALVHGMQLTCAIKGSSLAHRFGGNTSQEWMAAFHEHRWDLEEEAEQAIREQQEDRYGWVWLS